MAAVGFSMALMLLLKRLVLMVSLGIKEAGNKLLRREEQDRTLVQKAQGGPLSTTIKGLPSHALRTLLRNVRALATPLSLLA